MMHFRLGNTLRRFNFGAVNCSLYHAQISRKAHNAALGELTIDQFSANYHKMREPLTTSYIHTPGVKPFENLSLNNILSRAVRNFGDKEAFIFKHQGIRSTFAQLNKDSENFAAGMLRLGFENGDRCGIWGPNTYEWVVSFYGLSKIGVVPVCINSSYTSSELEYCLRKASCRGLVMAKGVRTLNYYNILNDIHPSFSTHSSEEVLKIPPLPALHHVISMEKENPQLSACLEFARFCEGQNEEDVKKVKKISKNIDPDAIANVQFTSGTTGVPKAVVQRQSSIVENSYAVGRVCANADKRVAFPIPFFHSFAISACVVSGVNCAFTSVIPSEVYEPISLLSAIAEEKCNVLTAVPAIVFDICNHPRLKEFDLSSLSGSAALFAAAPCPPALMQDFVQKTACKPVIGYGLTETSPCITMSCYSDSDRNRETVGYPMPFIEVKIANNDGETVAIGEKGEIWTRGYHVMQEYLDDEENTKQTINKAGWLKTGDIGRLSEEGYLSVLGRLKELIIRGGENISPAELENLLITHDSITECYVVGVPDARLGEEVCAVVRPANDNEDTQVLEKLLRQYVHAKLAQFKEPKYYWFLTKDDKVPMTASGKVNRIQLKPIAAKKLGLD